MVVIVTPDSAVVRRKGKEALFEQRDRVALVASLKNVSKTVLGNQDDSWSILKRIKPDVVCFGYDQKKAIKSLEDMLPALNIGNPKIVSAPSFKPKKYHSRHLKSKVHKE